MLVKVGLGRVEKDEPKKPNAQLISLFSIRDWLVVLKTIGGRVFPLGKLELYAICPIVALYIVRPYLFQNETPDASSVVAPTPVRSPVSTIGYWYVFKKPKGPVKDPVEFEAEVKLESFVANR